MNGRALTDLIARHDRSPQKNVNAGEAAPWSPVLAHDVDIGLLCASGRRRRAVALGEDVRGARILSGDFLEISPRDAGGTLNVRGPAATDAMGTRPGRPGAR